MNTAKYNESHIGLVLIKKVFDLKVYASLENNDIDLVMIKELSQKCSDLIVPLSDNELVFKFTTMSVKSDHDDLASDVANLVNSTSFE